jgi:hypothetical protein
MRQSPIFGSSGPLTQMPIRSPQTKVRHVRTNPKREQFPWISQRWEASITVPRRRPHLRGELGAHDHSLIWAMASTSSNTKGMSSRSKLYP